MMYCEFIEISEYGENYITFTEYHDYIEPIYMDADLSKLANKLIKSVAR